MKIYIKTYGCTLNQSDSELMAGLLQKAGHELVNSQAISELIIFNTCTVKDRSEKRFFSELKKSLANEKPVVVAGCVSQSDPQNELLKGLSILGVRHLERIAEVVEAASQGKMLRLLDFAENSRLNLPILRTNSVIEIIPICSGCLGDCSYCKTRFARGKLLSYSKERIIKQFERAVASDVSEVWLTGQDLGAYGKDIGGSLPDLLRELVKFKGKHRIRFGMINPNHALEYKEQLAEILEQENVFKFIHMPVQSGSDDILRLMNRKYNAQDFSDLVAFFRSKIPQITIATDIICGFPGEKEEDFEKTLSMVRTLKIPVLNISKFSPRPGTAASKMKKISTKIVKKRTLALTMLQEKIINNADWLGWEGRVIFDERGKKYALLGRNDFYKPIALFNENLSPGEIRIVRIIGAKQHYLESVLV